MMSTLKETITTSRDHLGVAALLTSCINSGMIDNLFDASISHDLSLKDISDTLEIDIYFVEPLIDLMTRSGILKKSGDCYIFCDREEYQYHRKMMNALPLYLELHNYLNKAKGRSVNIPFHFNQLITSASSRLAAPAISAIIQRHPPYMSGQIRVLDIGCGLGEYLISLAEKNPNMLGKGVEMDTVVARDAQAKVADRGLAERISIINADFLCIDDSILGMDYDFIMMNHIYHVVGEKLSRELTLRSKEFIKVGGYFFNMEICKDYPSDEALIPFLFDALMRFYYTENQAKAFRKKEIEAIMRDSGYSVDEKHHIPIQDFDTPNMVYFVGTKIK